MLAPDKGIVDQFLVNLLTAYQSINLAAISVQQTQLYPLDPAPDWMATINTNLSAAQEVASDWLINKGPQVIAQIPQSFISYSNSMQVTAGNIKDTTTTEDAVLRFQWLKKHMDRIPGPIAVQQQAIADVATSLEGYKTIIATTLTSVLASITTETTDINNVTSQISDLNDDISGETVLANGGMTGVISSGASLSVALLSYAYVATTVLSPAIPIAGIIVAVGGLTYGAISNAINEKKIVAKLEQIRDLQVTLSQDNQTLAILQSIQTMLQNLNTALTGIKEAMDLGTLWDDEQEKVNTLVSTLQNYKGTNFKDIDDVATLDDAVKVWTGIATSAGNIQKSAAGIATGGTIKISINYN